MGSCRAKPKPPSAVMRSTSIEAMVVVLPAPWSPLMRISPRASLSTMIDAMCAGTPSSFNGPTENQDRLISDIGYRGNAIETVVVGQGELFLFVFAIELIALLANTPDFVGVFGGHDMPGSIIPRHVAVFAEIFSDVEIDQLQFGQ